MTDKMEDKPLDAYERWMVKQNLEYVATDGLEVVVDRLRASGYNRVANALELVQKEIDNDERTEVSCRET